MNARAFEQAERGLRTSLHGNLRDWSLYDMLTWLVQTRRSAMIRVGKGLRASSVFVRSGQIFRVDHRGERGSHALRSLLTEFEGEFQLLLRPPPDAHPNVRVTTEELLYQAVDAINAHNAQLEAAAAG